MNHNEMAAPCVTTKAARDSRKTRPGSYRKAAPNSTARRPRSRSLRELQGDELLGTFLDLGGRS
jgi:hypothetical protein